MTKLCSMTTVFPGSRVQRNLPGRAGCVLATLCLALFLPAADAREQSGPEGIRPFENARVVESSGAGPVERHLVPVDRITRSGDAARSGPNRSIEGSRRGITWSHPRGVDAEDVFGHLRQQLPEEAWFQCDGRGCGASTYWAHDVFDIANLYGRDSSQHYVAVPRSTSEGPAVVMLYVSERGTGEVFAHVREILLADGANGQGRDSALSIGLRDIGVARLPEHPFGPDGDIASDAGPSLEAIERALAALPANDEVWIVVHMAGDPQSAVEASTDRARRLRDALEAPDVRLQAFGAGPLVPSVLGDAELRVELVRVR